MVGKFKQKHPSYGMVSWSRQQGGNCVLFGSELTHNETVCLRIYHASLERDLNHDWYYSGDTITEILLSPTQFADFLTSPNTQGTPCTLTYIQGEAISRPTFTPKTEIFRKEFEADLADLEELLISMVKLAEQLADAPRIKKSEIRELKSKVNRVKTELTSNMPYLYEQFVKNMVKTTQVAKAEVEAYVNRRIQETGLEVLQKGIPRLLEEKKD